MLGAKNKQHFVPQCYLSSFADSNRRLYVFDKFERRSYKAHVKDVAQKHRFYDFPQISDDDTPVADDVVFSLNFKEDMPDPQIVEKIFAKLEEDYATAMRTLQQNIMQRKPLSLNKSTSSHILSQFSGEEHLSRPRHGCFTNPCSETDRWPPPSSFPRDAQSDFS
jgi:hypothetical protein